MAERFIFGFSREIEMNNKSIKLNFIMNALLTMSNLIFPLITFPYVSRILLPVGTGKVAFATSIVTYFSMFAQLGIPAYGIRACAQVRDDKEKLSRTVQELLLISLVMTVLAYVLFGVGLCIIPRMRSDKSLFLVVSAMIFFNSIGMEWLYKGLEEYTYITVRSIAFKLVSLGAMFLLVTKQSDYVIYGGVSIFASSASNILNFANAHKYVSLHPAGKYNFKQHLKPIIVFFAMSCATTIYTNLDTVMLGFIKTDEDVGYYNAAVKIKGILVSIITSLGTVLLPRASYYIEHELKNEFEQIAKKAINFVCVASLPMMIYFILYAREGIYFLSGSAYEGAVFPMQILMPTLFFIGLTNIIGIQVMVPLGKESWVLYSVTIGAVVDMIINALLIPFMASSGAAIGTLIAETAVFAYQYWKLKNLMHGIFENVQWRILLLAILVAAVASIGVKVLALGTFFSLVLSASIYFGIYGIILIIAGEPLVKEIWQQVTGKLKIHKEG